MPSEPAHVGMNAAAHRKPAKMSRPTIAQWSLRRCLPSEATKMAPSVAPTPPQASSRLYSATPDFTTRCV